MTTVLWRSAVQGSAVLAAFLGAAGCAPAPVGAPPPEPARVYTAGEVDERAEIVLTPPLRYPEDARLADVDGVVVVRVVIDTAGNPEPTTVAVVQTPDSLLGAAGRAVVLRTLFRPARVRGRVVQVLVDVPVDFSHASLPPVSVHIAGDVYDLNDVQERPRITLGLGPAYPAPLLLAGVEGRVVVQLIVDTTGQVEAGSMSVVETTDLRFVPAAKDYLLKARFSPGRIVGRPVRVRLQIPVEFRLPSKR